MKKSYLLSLLTILFLGISMVGATPKILVVSSYDKAYSWNRDIVDAIETVLGRADVEQRFFYMDTRLKDDEQWKIKAGVIALDLMAEWQPDVVIACDDNAQKYFASKISEQSDVQVVFCGVNADPAEYGYPKKNVTGVKELTFPVASLEALSELIPGLKRIAFIGDHTRSAEGMIDYLKKTDMGKFNSIGYYKFSKLEDLLLSVKNLGKICDVFYLVRILGLQDENGELYEPDRVMERILEVTNIPVLGLSDYIIENGALYGIVPDPKFHGAVAAEIALQLAFDEKKASDIPVISLESDFSELKDGKSYLNLNTAIEKGYRIPLGLINETDVIISDIQRAEEIVLDYYTLIAGQIFKEVADYLRMVAAASVTSEGDWEAIKAIYQKSTVDYPGIFLYILPNGEYYTDIRNFTATSLSDRAYFKSLKEGKEVLGYPVTSRSTGKKSAVFAIPVEHDGIISAFTGMSLYMEEINSHVNHLMDLDPSIFILAVDQTGTVMMTNQEKYMYRHVDDIIESDPGTFSERLALEEEGKIAFENGYGEYYGIFKTEETTGWRFVFAEKIHDVHEEPGLNEMIEKSSVLMETVVRHMNTLEDEVIETSKLFADSVELPQAIHGILDTLYSRVTRVYNIAFVNTDGIMAYMAPEYFSRYEGTDISDQEQVIRIAKTYNPVVSQLLMMEEGIYGIDIEWPVFNRKGVFVGSISMLINPEDYFEDIAAEYISDPDLEIWVMQQDGTIIYDADTIEIGRNLFEDGLYADYPELLELGRQMQRQNEGTGAYTFLAAGQDMAVRKEIVWQTVYFHGTEWKIVLARRH